jgi:hypothetical protein
MAMRPIDDILKRLHNIQTSCFGTSVGFNVDAGQGVTADKLLRISMCVGKEEKTYMISSEMSREEVYYGYGKVLDDVNKLLETHVGKTLNKHGRVKKQV